MQRLPDSHTPLEEARVIAAHLIEDRFSAELAHLLQARIWCVRSERQVLVHGHPAAAYICKPRVQGPMSALVEDLLAQAAGFDGHDPDFIIRFDAATWDELGYSEPARDWWLDLGHATPDTVTWTIGRERLVFHELKHVYQRTNSDGDLMVSDEDGRPVLALRPHDAELFHAEVESYGPSVCDAVDTALAIAAGGRREHERTRQRTQAA